jgi:hypothetical protein
VGLSTGKADRLRSSQDSVDEGREVAHGVTTIRSVRYETASFCIFSPTCNHRQSCFDRKLSDLLPVPEGHWTGDRDNRVRPFASDRTEDLGKIVAVRHRLNVKRDIDAPGRSLIGFPLLFLTGVDTVRQNRDLGSFRRPLGMAERNTLRFTPSPASSSGRGTPSRRKGIAAQTLPQAGAWFLAALGLGIGHE